MSAFLTTDDLTVFGSILRKISVFSLETPSNGIVMMMDVSLTNNLVRSKIATFPAFVFENPDGFGLLLILKDYENDKND